MDKEHLWRVVLGEIEVSLSKAGFATWFSKTWIATAEDTKISIATPNNFHKEYLKKNYDKTIRQVLIKHVPGLRTVEYKVASQTQEIPLPVSELKADPEPIEDDGLAWSTKPLASKLNPRYIFESFVVGDSNKLAHAAAKAVVANPGMTYNPLFIYGGAGLGKTHLMQAIGNDIMTRYPKKTVVYVTSEHFTNEYVDAIKNQKTKEFRNKYRKIDCLLFDDVQFLSGKEGVQEAFFWTFNTLYEDGRQIVVASDQVPKQIPALEERLGSRLEWGLIVDISPPNYETRLAILQSKAEQFTPQLPNNILKKIANMFTNNVRELEGALKRITAFAQLNDSIPADDEVETLLGGLVGEGKGKADVRSQDVIKVVAQYFKIPKSELTGKKRNQEIVVPRQICIYLLREEMDLPYTQIGDLMGGRDHTTIMHDYKKVKGLLIDNIDTANQMKKIKNIIYNK